MTLLRVLWSLDPTAATHELNMKEYTVSLSIAHEVLLRAFLASSLWQKTATPNSLIYIKILS